MGTHQQIISNTGIKTIIYYEKTLSVITTTYVGTEVFISNKKGKTLSLRGF